MKLILGGFIASLFVFGCNEKASEPEKKSLSEGKIIAIESHVEVTKEPASQIEKGRRLYLSNCISCHNKDPSLKGPIGPEIVDAPMEVMTSKIMTGAYPAVLPQGFVPRRKTKLMRPIPKLKDDISAIYEYVQSMKKKS